MQETDLTNRGLARRLAIYGVGFVLNRLGSVIMLPVTTRVLTPAEYGLLYLVQIVTEVAAILVTEGTTAGFLRFYYAAKSEREKAEVTVSTLYLLAAQQVIGALILIVGAPLIWRLAFNSAGDPGLVRLAGACFLATSLLPVPLLLMQAQQRSALHTAYTAVQVASSVIFNVLFLVVWRQGARSMLLSALITFTAIGIPALVWMLRQTGVRGHLQTALTIRRFGFPYQLATAGAFVLNFGDRFFLQHSRSTAETGLYTLAYQFGFLTWSLSAQPFFQAWLPLSFQLATLDPAERDRRFNEGLLASTVIICAASVGVSAIAGPMLAVIASPSYAAAAALIPAIMIAFLFQAWYTVFKTGADISGRTRAVPAATWCAVVVILCCYALLIPRFGGQGAAAATIVGFAVRTAVMYRGARDALPIRWQLRQPATVVGLTSITLIHVALTSPATLSWQLVQSVAVPLVFGIALWTGVLHSAQRERLGHAARNATRALRERLA